MSKYVKVPGFDIYGVSEHGDILTFDHVIDFNDARMYDEWRDREFSTKALCGEEGE